MEMKKSYDIAYKVQVCKRVIEAGELVPTVATELDINENTLYTWVSKYKENKIKPFVGSGNIKPEDEAFKKLLRENRELKEENEILKKAAVYFAKNLK